MVFNAAHPGHGRRAPKWMCLALVALAVLAAAPVLAADKLEVLTLSNLQQAFRDVQVEVDEHTVVLPGHEH